MNVFELKQLIRETSFWPASLHTSHMDLMISQETTALRDSTILADLNGTSEFLCICKPFIFITNVKSGLHLTAIGQESSVVTASENPGEWEVTRSSDGISVVITSACRRILGQDRLGRIHLLQPVEHAADQNCIEWQFEDILHEGDHDWDSEVRIRNLRYKTLLVEKRALRLAETPQHDVKSDAGSGDSVAARWTLR
eukprot:TRINITY_DN56791_c0_g1_i1.p2 TRINITY_DN56791_c0_g1~~TRINITY_DN56791_c0_g1_i1.p2  ORF type:complete len:197 (+),score=12.24 TRINITY_DN56791_c0_g1_i1:934-1524(+)